MAIVNSRIKENLSLEYAAVVDILKGISPDVKIFVDMHHDGAMLIDNSIDILNSLNDDIIIVPLASHPSELVTYAHWWDRLTLLNKPVLVLTSHPIEHTNSLYCPIWPILYPSEYVDIIYPTEEQCINPNRSYMYSCLNNRFTLDRAINLIVWEKYHRVVTPEHLVTMIYSESVIKTDPEAKEQLMLLDKTLATKDQTYKNIFYNKLLPYFPIEHKEAQFYLDPFELMNSAFLDSNLNVITEHWHFTQTPFISEKSLKPILAGQFFVNTGSVGTIEAMRDLGFDTFDDIIDHSVYTDETDLLEKMEKIHQYLSDIKRRDWVELYKLTHQRRLNNRNLLISNQIKNNFSQQLQTKIYEILR
jgi:hypothetical protein